MGVLTAYARTLSDGMRISVRVDSRAALTKYEAGKDLFFRRIGQLNAACAGCHLYNAGKIMRIGFSLPFEPSLFLAANSSVAKSKSVTVTPRYLSVTWNSLMIL